MLQGVCLNTALGGLRLLCDERGLRFLLFEGEAGPFFVPSEGHGLLREAGDQIRAFLDGRLRCFDLPLAPDGTVFQRRVWSVLQAIPYGETRSYGEVALALGQSGAARAVGRANGKNPLPVFIPCHRVILAGGGLGGYSSGLARKRLLLDLEAGR
ncbi:methylated-DNA--[protein]-cysteine S-methyltransferase [Desulfobotulus sp.]|uniref:methylated-DNA--[protein]-cysteine S-methyltransferase n=1 Tax=Desulfobotulus sp. TaxID=1940337 RepID=UPI002A36C27F|nr:methylated-DNA--[protein]-cysteine S-methyltransferase [Desulfobotulus sp.]MDY0162721.1 methylated-DNA--[protein]-cysteine S-methyltransferase [Desulfobotulus sp.]